MCWRAFESPVAAIDSLLDRRRKGNAGLKSKVEDDSDDGDGDEDVDDYEDDGDADGAV